MLFKAASYASKNTKFINQNDETFTILKGIIDIFCYKKRWTLSEWNIILLHGGLTTIENKP